MKIEKVIHASNDEPFYLDFWEVVSKIWKLKFEIEPILLYFGNSIVSEKYGTVIKMPEIKDIPLSTCCQLSRYWYPITEQNTTFMTSDIDMLPISVWYFKDQIESISDDKFVNLNCVQGDDAYYPCCYNVAKGRVFKEVLNLPNSWEEFICDGFWKKIQKNHVPQGLNKNLPHWSADEEWSSRLIKSFDKNRIVRIFREGGTNSKRIDRPNWHWEEHLINHYYDCHCIRPYSVNKNEIDRLVTAILK